MKSSSLFPPISSKYLKNSNKSDNSADSMSSLKKYKKIKYLGKGSYGAALLVILRYDFFLLYVDLFVSYLLFFRSNPTQQFVIKEIVIG